LRHAGIYSGWEEGWKWETGIKREFAIEIRNPKLEIRNKSEIQMTKARNSAMPGGFEFLPFSAF
jgi:hypothetical protein